jgi:DNA-binding transcriptional ArsR family regulator
MAKKYLMFSLDDGKTEKLGGILENKTSRRILDLLTDCELSESEIAERLHIPLNTVGYNIKKLKEVGLIREERHFFSVRGKRIPVYAVSNKDIVISPKKSINDKLRNSAALVSISGIFTAFILWYNKSGGFVKDAMLKATAETQTYDVPAPMIQSGFSFGPVGWFLLGAWLLVLGFVVWTLVKSNRSVRR